MLCIPQARIIFFGAPFTFSFWCLRLRSRWYFRSRIGRVYCTRHILSWCCGWSCNCSHSLSWFNRLRWYLWGYWISITMMDRPRFIIIALCIVCDVDCTGWWLEYPCALEGKDADPDANCTNLLFPSACIPVSDLGPSCAALCCTKFVCALFTWGVATGGDCCICLFP